MDATALRQARRDLGLSINALARAVGATGRTVRRWEAGSLAIPLRIDEQIRAEIGALQCSANGATHR